jgi:hypothetical protein
MGAEGLWLADTASTLEFRVLHVVCVSAWWRFRKRSLRSVITPIDMSTVDGSTATTFIG